MNLSPLGRETVARPQRDWTFLHVLDGDNDLREAVTLDLVELDREGAPDNVNIAAQLYRGELRWGLKTLGQKLKSLGQPELKPAIKDDWRGMKVFEVRHRDDSASATKEVAYPSVDAAPNDPNSLEEFLLWGMANYPAKNYVVVLGGHGTAGGVLPDGKGNMMPIEQAGDVLRSVAVKTGKKPAVVVLDACSTAGPTTTRALQDSADFLVASPVPIRGRGWSEAHTLSTLANQKDLTPEGLALSFLSEKHSAVDHVHVYNLSDGSLQARR